LRPRSPRNSNVDLLRAPRFSKIIIIIIIIIIQNLYSAQIQAKLESEALV